jgi:hypothetical protein
LAQNAISLNLDKLIYTVGSILHNLIACHLEKSNHDQTNVPFIQTKTQFSIKKKIKEKECVSHKVAYKKKKEIVSSFP